MMDGVAIMPQLIELMSIRYRSAIILWGQSAPA